jgi:integrase
MAKRKITDGLRLKKNGVWERAEIIDGKRRWFSSKDPEEVWRKRNAAIAAAEAKQQEEETGPLFEEVADVYEKSVYDMKYGTRKVYLPAIRRAKEYFKDRRIKDIEPYEIAEYLRTLSNMSRTTVLNQKTVLNAIFQTWIESAKWHGDHNAARLVNTPHGLRKTKREPPTANQVEIVKAHYREPDALPAVVYLCTGERKGEACGIQLKDIDFEKGIIKITKQVIYIGNRPHVVGGTKTAAGVREIPLLQMLREALEPLRSLPPDTYIIGCGKNPVSATQYNTMWVSFWRKYGMAHCKVSVYNRINTKGAREQYHHAEWVADVCAHQFRHEYVCMLAEAGVPESIAIQIVGHANAKMIHEVYMSLKSEMVNDTREKLNMILSEASKSVD